MQTAINGVSNYFIPVGFSDSTLDTDHEDSYRTGVLGRCRGWSSSTLYPLGCTHYEGPQNELDEHARQDVHGERDAAVPGAVHDGASDARRR